MTGEMRIYPEEMLKILKNHLISKGISPGAAEIKSDGTVFIEIEIVEGGIR